MPLLQILMVLIAVGVLLWLVDRFIPMQGTIKSILNGVVVIATVLWLLNIFGLFIRYLAFGLELEEIEIAGTSSVSLNVNDRPGRMNKRPEHDSQQWRQHS